MVPNKDLFENLFFNFFWQTSFYEESYIGFKKTLSEKKDLDVKTTYRKILFLEKNKAFVKTNHFIPTNFFNHILKY